MNAQPTDERRCPVCGESYDRRLVVERGDRWADLFPGSPLDIFATYERWCTARYDDQTDTRLPERKCAVFLHDPDRRVALF